MWIIDDNNKHIKEEYISLKDKTVFFCFSWRFLSSVIGQCARLIPNRFLLYLLFCDSIKYLTFLECIECPSYDI